MRHAICAIVGVCGLLAGCTFPEWVEGNAALHPVGGGQPDFVHARELFKAGAEKGNGISQSKYAAMCLAGLGGPVDLRSAFEHLQVADKQNLPIAAMLLADLYAQGAPSIGVAADLDRAIAYAHRAEGNNKKAVADYLARLERRKRGESPDLVVERKPRTPSVKDGGSANGDVRPEFLQEAYPAYPIPLLVLGLEATALVDFVVEPDGVPAKVHVVSPTLPAFDAAAVSAVANSRFRPGLRAGKPVATHMRVPIQFALK